MKQNKNNTLTIVLVSLGVAAVTAVGVVVLVKLIKKNKARKALIPEWNDEEAFDESFGDDCEIVVIEDEI